MKERVYWIDNMKAIGIILVLIGHNESSITQYIYSFHMPLFFFISGLLFVYDKEIKITSYIKKKFKSLIIPYLKISSVLFLIWFALKGRSEGLTVIFKNLFGIVYAQGGHEYMNWGVPMWFIPCLFIVTVSLFCIMRFKNNWIKEILFCSSIIGFGIGLLRKNMMLEGASMTRLPWGIDVAMVGIVFFFVGYKLKDVAEQITSKKINIILSSILFFSVMILAKINGRIDMYTLNYKNYFLFFITAFVGILAVIYISKLILRNKVFLNIGKNTIYLLAFHINILSLMKKVIRIFMEDATVVEGFMRNDIMAIVITPIIQISSVMIAIYILSRIKGNLRVKTT